MSSAGLRLVAVSSGYDGNQVLTDVSLEVGRGQCVAIIGPNGHGKTTLLRTVSGLVRPRSGSIHLDGRDITRLRPHQIAAAGIAHVPQGDLLFPNMTVLENLQMGAYLREASRTLETSLSKVFELLPMLSEPSRAWFPSGG